MWSDNKRSGVLKENNRTSVLMSDTDLYFVAKIIGRMNDVSINLADFSDSVA
jgi:hypothetical protein